MQKCLRPFSRCKNASSKMYDKVFNMPLLAVMKYNLQIRRFFWSVFSRIRTEYRDKKYPSVFSPNAGKHGPEKICIWALFTQWDKYINFTNLLQCQKDIKVIHWCSWEKRQMQIQNSSIPVNFVFFLFLRSFLCSLILLVTSK